MAHVCVAMDFCDLQYHVQAACQNRFSSKKKKKTLEHRFYSQFILLSLSSPHAYLI